MYLRDFSKIVLFVILSASWLACQDYEDSAGVEPEELYPNVGAADKCAELTSVDAYDRIKDSLDSGGLPPWYVQQYTADHKLLVDVTGAEQRLINSLASTVSSTGDGYRTKLKEVWKNSKQDKSTKTAVLRATKAFSLLARATAIFAPISILWSLTLEKNSCDYNAAVHTYVENSIAILNQHLNKQILNNAANSVTGDLVKHGNKLNEALTDMADIKNVIADWSPDMGNDESYPERVKIIDRIMSGLLTLRNMRSDLDTDRETYFHGGSVDDAIKPELFGLDSYVAGTIMAELYGYNVSLTRELLALARTYTLDHHDAAIENQKQNQDILSYDATMLQTEMESYVQALRDVNAFANQMRKLHDSNRKILTSHFECSKSKDCVKQVGDRSPYWEGEATGKFKVVLYNNVQLHASAPELTVAFEYAPVFQNRFSDDPDTLADIPQEAECLKPACAGGFYRQFHSPVYTFSGGQPLRGKWGGTGGPGVYWGWTADEFWKFVLEDKWKGLSQFLWFNPKEDPEAGNVFWYVGMGQQRIKDAYAKLAESVAAARLDIYEHGKSCKTFYEENTPKSDEFWSSWRNCAHLDYVDSLRAGMDKLEKCVKGEVNEDNCDTYFNQL